jgi:hypothetical protein
MKFKFFQSSLPGCRFVILVAVFFGLVAWRNMAAASLYENDAVTTDPIPIPDATNFVNNSSFTIDFPYITPYQTHDTLNYTNNGYMDSVFGFYFDHYSTSKSLNYEAANFDNENVIESGLQINVWATNIVNPGWMYVDSDSGLIQLTGDSVNLDDATMLIESVLGSGGVNVYGEDYGVGISPKAWTPSTELGANFATSAFYNSVLNPNPNNATTLSLVNSSCYVDTAGSISNVIYRVIFVEDENPDVTNNAYFEALPDGSHGLATVGWTGVYTNNATGQTATNYLYLQDEPVLVFSNNVSLVKVATSINGGIPNNYTIEGSQTPLLSGPTAAGFNVVFPSGSVTNFYSYLQAQLIPTTVPTNSLVMTNVSAIGGRIEINAGKELQLNNAQISGANYMSLAATNEFDGNLGASIAVPYSDINIGVSNGVGLAHGNLAVTNLLEPALPVWNGTIQAWTSRWIMLTTNTIGTNSFTVTNDFRVELVLDNLTPTTPSQVQNLELTGTNSVVISDDLNVFGSLFMNTRSLTITTNGIGIGAESEEGELNLENNNVLGPSSLPYLQWLTNNGVINVGNQAMFGSAKATFVTNIIPAVPAVAATASLSEVHGVTNVMSANKVSIGAFTYTFVKKVTNSIPNQIKIASSFGGSISNLIEAINHSKGTGDGLYSSKTVKNTWVTASKFTNGVFFVTAITNGVAGNSIVVTNTSPNLVWSSNFLSGGVNAIPKQTNIVAMTGPYQSFVNSGMISDYGSQIYSGYFANGGLINNNAGFFTLTSGSAVFTNGELFAYSPLPPTFNDSLSGNVTLTASNLVISNLVLEAGGGLTLQVTNLLTDTGASNGNAWFLGGASSLLGLDLPVKPVTGDLSGTTIEMLTPAPNKTVKNYWSGQDYGVSTIGYSNNEEIGQLVLDVATPNSAFYFSGPPGSRTNNAIYVDRLVLENYASYANGAGTANIPTLMFNTNLVIYYADAVASSAVSGGSLEDVSYLLNGSNTNHLQWVPQYTGFFSTTNIVYPDGTTYAINAGLASSPWDSTGDGVPNYENPYPVFEPGEVNFTFSLTNVPPPMGVLTWDSIPGATNDVLYTTNLASQNWMVVTNFVSPNQILTPSTWPITNVLLEPLHMTIPHGYYRIRVSPNSADVYP